MNREEFIISVKELGINLTEIQLEQLDIYADFLIEYNEHTNLTAIKTLDGIYLKHFYDSLTLIKAIDLNSINSLVDIGTGAGFPGMVLKIVFPHLETVLIDSNNKKINFLNELIKKLELKEIKAINTRSEEYALDNLDKYDLVTARAVTTLPVLAELCLPLVKENGYFIPLKASIDLELEYGKKMIETLNGTIEEIKEFKLPVEDSIRTIIKVKKNGSTPKGYPRTFDKIKKSLKKNTK